VTQVGPGRLIHVSDVSAVICIRVSTARAAATARRA